MVLRAIIAGVDMGSVDAWELLTIATGKLALRKYDALADGGVQAAFVDDGGAAALEVARDLNYAAQLCESLFQIMIFDTARVIFLVTKVSPLLGLS